MARLYYYDGDGNEQCVSMGAEHPEVMIGRQGECEIATMNSTVSRKHCMVRFEGGGFTAIDQGSSNGTFYKGEQSNEFGLDDGDVFLCGNFEIRFEVDAEDLQEDASESDEDEALELLDAEGVDSEMIVESANDTEMELGEEAAEVAAQLEDDEAQVEGGGETLRDFEDSVEADDDLLEAEEVEESQEILEAEEVLEAEVLDEVVEADPVPEAQEVEEVASAGLVDGAALEEALAALAEMAAKVEALEARLVACESQEAPEQVDLTPLTEGLARVDAQLEANAASMNDAKASVDELRAGQSAQETAMNDAIASMGNGNSTTDALQNPAFWAAFGEVAASFQGLAAAAEQMRASMADSDDDGQ